MDVNEQIAKAYFEEVKGYMVKTNHYFKKVREKGSGPSDIDLILQYPNDKDRGEYGEKAICSVKGWQSHKIKLDDIMNKNKFKKEWKVFEQDELDAAEDFFKGKDFNKILLLPPIKRQDIDKAKEYCLETYDIMLLDFSEILIQLMKHLAIDKNANRAYDLEVLQTLRMVHINLISIIDNEVQLQDNLVDFLKIDKDNLEAKMWRTTKIKIRNAAQDKNCQ